MNGDSRVAYMLGSLAFLFSNKDRSEDVMRGKGRIQKILHFNFLGVRGTVRWRQPSSIWRIMVYIVILFNLGSHSAIAKYYNGLYVTDGVSNLYTINNLSGAATFVGPIGISNATDIAFFDSSLYGITFTSFLKIDADTGKGTIIGNLGTSEMNALAVAQDGTVYAAGTSGEFIRIDPQTGVGTTIGYYGTNIVSSGDLAFSPNGNLYASVKVTGYGGDYLAKVNKYTGSARIIGSIGYSNVYGLSFKDGVLYGTTDNGYLLKIDASSGMGTYVGENYLNQWGMATAPLVNAMPSVNTHWYNWATTFSTYSQLIKKFAVVRDGAWWGDLESIDYITDADWANAAWSYPYHLTLANCNQSVTYQSGYDNLVNKFQDQNTPDLLMILNTDNKNINSNPNNITYTQYYDYVQHVVSRYNKNSSGAMSGLNKSVKYYEIGNEPDNPTLNGGLTLSNYVNNRLIPAYRAAKQANPEAIVLNAGLYLGGDGGFDVSYLDNMLSLLKQNGGESNNYYMDILAIHYYYHPQDPEYFLANIDKVRQIMSKYNISSKPLWITEYGVATKIDIGGQIREEDQGSVLLRFNCLMKLSNIDNSIIYNLKDINSSNLTWENTYGLYKVICQQNNEQIMPKVAMQVLNNFYEKTRGLNNININPQEERNSGIYKLTFSNGSKYAYIIWYTKMDGTGISPDHANETTTINVFMEGGKGILSDMYGNVLINNLYNGIPIPIGEQPMYIESQKQISTSFIGVLHLLLQ